MLARETTELSTMVLSVSRCERQHISGELLEHTEYIVRIETEETSFTVRRRYSHFLALHQKVTHCVLHEPLSLYHSAGVIFVVRVGHRRAFAE